MDGHPQYWVYGVPCITQSREHDWVGTLCISCGLAVKKKRRVPASLSRRLLLRGDKDECVYCKHPLDDKSRSVDHVIPRARGGSNRLENLVLSCKACNIDKRDRLLHEWTKRWYEHYKGKAKERYFKKFCS